MKPAVNSMPMAQVKPNTWNPNEMTPAEFAELVAELDHLGKPAKPIVLRPNGKGYEIVDGEHTYRALLELGKNELLPGWYEIEDLDDLEAMRQTYKRNQHGKHNQVKQGRLFRHMLDESGLSQRALAEQIGVSEGTIRNSLEYLKAAEVRNDYAFEKLTVNQVRMYNRAAETLPALVTDLWLECGADPKAFNDVSIKKGHILDTVIFLENAPEKALSLLPGLVYQHSGGGFNAAVERLYTLDQARKVLEGRRPLTWDQVHPYITVLTHFHWEDTRGLEYWANKIIGEVFRLRQGLVEAVIPIEEYNAWIESGEWKNTGEMLDGIGLLLSKYADDASMRQSLRSQLMERELKKAPDFIRLAEGVPIWEKYEVLTHPLLTEAGQREIIGKLVASARAEAQAEILRDQGKPGEAADLLVKNTTTARREIKNFINEGRAALGYRKCPHCGKTIPPEGG